MAEAGAAAPRRTAGQVLATQSPPPQGPPRPHCRPAECSRGLPDPVEKASRVSGIVTQCGVGSLLSFVFSCSLFYCFEFFWR